MYVLLAAGSRDGAVVRAHQCGSGKDIGLLYILVCCLTGSYQPNKDDDYQGGDVTWVLFLSSTIYGLR